MKINFFLLVSLIVFTKTVCAQEKITKIYFPYHKNYILQLSGLEKKWSLKNDSLIKNDSTKVSYDITNEMISENGNNDTTVFKTVFINGKDTFPTDYCKLWINKKGMFYSSKNDTTHTITEAISLPLYKGKAWKTSIGGYPVTSTCISIDTDIYLMSERFNCFCIQTKKELKKSDAAETYKITTEFYNQQTGKVAYIARDYVHYFKTGNTYLYFKRYQLLSNYGVKQ